MRVFFLRVVFLLSLCTAFQPLIAQIHDIAPQPAVTVDEGSARLTLNDASSIFSIELSAATDSPLSATFTAKIVDPDEKVIAQATVPVQLTRQAQRVQMALNWIPKGSLTDTVTARVRYEVRIGNDQPPTVAGTLSPTAIIPDLFELRFMGLEFASAANTYIAHVWATRPNSSKPVSGVELTGWLGDEDEATGGIRAQGRTNLHGEATLSFHLPVLPPVGQEEDVDLEIRGKRAGFQNSVTGTLKLWEHAAILLSTDKPLYQPEQVLHMRALLLDDQRHAWGQQPVRFEARDPDDAVVFSADAKSSRFGIASSEWAIPASQKLGNYRVSVKVSGDTDSKELQTDQRVRISRYELPTFTVNVTTDHPYYLPGQNAEVVVSASYLFGQPVVHGHARIVHESSRTWNYRKQKWDAEESWSKEGEIDTKGEFHATLDMAKDHSDLGAADWERYRDLRFAAYITDASSGRTQERRFDVRITHEAIHLYVVNMNREVPVGLPPVFYVSAATADGTPTVGEVVVKLFSADPTDATDLLPITPFATTKVRTNRFGVARARTAAPLVKGKDANRIYVVLEAKTLDGRTGKHMETYYLGDDPSLRLTPSKAIFSPGEPIEAVLEASGSAGKVRIEAVRSDTQTVLASQELRITGGQRHIIFPTDKQFVGVITILASWSEKQIDPTYYSKGVASSASVIFPHPSGLQLDVKPAKNTYRPGEAASVNLRVRSLEGQGTQGALGLLVYDQAVEELARTEASLSTHQDENIDPRLGFRPFEEYSDTIGGVSTRDLLNLAPGGPVSPDLELVAEALLFMRVQSPFVLEESDHAQNLGYLFEKQIHKTLDPAEKILQEHFTAAGHFPADDAQYSQILASAAMNASTPTDPWGRPYRIERSYRWNNEILQFRSDGPDKTAKTEDDFTAVELSRPFFEHDAKRLRAILDAYHTSTGAYVRDQAALMDACERSKTALNTFIDPWGTPYRFLFDVARDKYTVTVESAGPDKRFRSKSKEDSDDADDLTVGVLPTPYFLDARNKISDALMDAAKKSAHFPENEQEFRKVMQEHGLDWDTIRDPWGRPYRVVSSIDVSYGDKISLHAYGDKQTGKQTPVTRRVRALAITSDGPDLTPYTADDFVLARFASPFADETGVAGEPSAQTPKPLPVYTGNSGAVRVQVLDPTGAVIVAARITATDASTGIVYNGIADDQGVCLLGNLPPGNYRILVESAGFQPYVLTNVPVLSSNVTDLEITLHLGAAAESVTVEANAVQLNTMSASLAGVAPGVVALSSKSGASGKIAILMATPRLREYFPETLLWQPEVLTDRSGHATLKIPLADSITTWKVSVIASTLDGQIATATKEIRAFQPFFAELDPPKVLTVGDEIHLPVTVRNYLDKPQDISLEWAAEPWSQTLSSLSTDTVVAAGDYAQKTFSFRAITPMKDAKQRLSAYNRSSVNESDAIEKKLRVHPDGQEQILQASSIFSKDSTLTINIPPNAIPGSIESELVVYPNLMAHVANSIEGIMERPYGCAEQTISSAYPSLLWLQLKKAQQLPASPLDSRAHHYLNLAYAKLLGYREPSGGISYWGRGEPYIPLTAYGLRFLTEASEFISVDPEVIAVTRNWLLQQITPRGAVERKDSLGQNLDWATTSVTAYVALILAKDLQRRDASEKDVEVERTALRRAMNFLTQRSAPFSDPYNLALLALAKLSLKEDALGEIAELLAMQHPEGELSYWSAEHNTVFYGWGYSGRIETTALVLDALATSTQQGHGTPEMEGALGRGTLFVLKNKDQYGVWYTTQATVNVLQSLVRQLEVDSKSAALQSGPLRTQIDGKPGPDIAGPVDARQLNPLRVNLTSFLAPGEHHVEIRGGATTRASAYLTVTYYAPWTVAAAAPSTIRSGDSESLRYSVQFDRHQAAVGDLIRCTVHAERVGFRGYGMMLAEIGLPPGADVDRASLEKALTDSSWEIQSYEIQPDRVVVYLWPLAGGSTFNFLLKPRFAMNAQSAESILYDYYNPEARASVRPDSFLVH